MSEGTVNLSALPPPIGRPEAVAKETTAKEEAPKEEVAAEAAPPKRRRGRPPRQPQAAE